MTFKWLASPFLLLSLPALLAADEPSWEGKTVVLTRPGVELAKPEGKDIAPRTSGVARDLAFTVRKEENGRLLVDSRRQQGWIARSDAIPFDQAVAHFTKELASNPKNSHALTARGIALSSGKDSDRALPDLDA